MKPHNKAVPASYLILEKDGKILVARRCNTGYMDGYYQIPAGHVDEGELPAEAMVREAKEEIGIDIDLGDMKFVHVSYRHKHDETGDRIDFYFKAKKWTGEVVNMEPNKCDDLKWVSYDDLPENTTEHVRNAIKAIQKGKYFGSQY